MADDENPDDYDEPGPSTGLAHGFSTVPVPEQQAPPAVEEEAEPAEEEPAPSGKGPEKPASTAAAGGRAATGSAATTSGKNESARQLVQRSNKEEGIDWFQNLTEEQLNRYECFKNTNLFPIGQAGAQGARGKKAIVQLIGGDRMIDRSDGKQLDRLVLVLGGVTKVFIAELTERARIVATREGHAGTLLPLHYHTAHEELIQEGKIPGKQPKKRQRFMG